ncbi:MAG: nucleotidyl transferase AbiEii/AbiGii toxin family protein [Oligoflexia bacterium]|nr:nucleotidyl transferase AbiEii/AbiGii toxin family protein [Oligoflexia bacterium]
MNSKYTQLYKIQDRVLAALKPVLSGFYLTGGTALGRFYLDHRLSEDLDFFVNQSGSFKKDINKILKELQNKFDVSKSESVIYDDFAKFYINDDKAFLKIEFVNDVEYHSGKLNKYKFGLVDTPLNILANKVTALSGRDEPKDIFDIYYISLSYHFNWVDILDEAKKKAIFNEIDISQKINSFPVEMFDNVDWLHNTFNHREISNALKVIAGDIIRGDNNSLADADKRKIQDAVLLRLYDK